MCIYIIRRNSPRYGKADHYFYIHRNNDRLKREREKNRIEKIIQVKIDREIKRT